MKDSQIEFLYQSISDAQSTIRAIDVKLGFLFVVVLLPVVAIPKLHEVYLQIKKVAFYSVSSCLLLVLWLLSLYLLYKALVSIRNPALIIENIDADDNCSFYNSDLFELMPLDAFFNLPISSRKSIEAKCNSLPNSQEKILSVLMYESIKISYIRDIKIKRSTWCMCCTFLFVSLGSFVWALSVFKVGL